MKKLLLVLLAVIPLTSLTCGSGTAMAAPRKAPLYVKGQSPHRVMEHVGDMKVELRSTGSRNAAYEALRHRAAELGADAIVDVVVELVEVEVAVSDYTGLPLAVMGGLVSLLTWDPDPLKDALDSASAHVIRRNVLVARGVAVRFVR